MEQKCKDGSATDKRKEVSICPFTVYGEHPFGRNQLQQKNKGT